MFPSLRDMLFPDDQVTHPSTTTSNRVQKFMFNVTNSNKTKLTDLLAFLCRRFSENNSDVNPGCSMGWTKITPQIPLNPRQVIKFVTLNESVADIPENQNNNWFLAFLLVAIMVTALFGNALVLGTLACNRLGWTNMDISVLSLALSDVLVSMICIPQFLDQVINRDWTFGSLSCRAVPFFMQLAVSANMLTLCCLAVDRYLAVVYPLKFNTFKSMRTTQGLILSAWIVAFATASPNAFRYDFQTFCGQRGTNGSCQQAFQLCLSTKTVDDYHLVDRTVMTWISFVLLFVCPSLIMGVAYGIIIYTLWVKATVGMVAISAAAVRNRYKRKAVKMLLCVVLLFILSWAPLKFWGLIAAEEGLELTATTRTVDLYLKCLAISSTAYNPIVYAFMNQKFRSHFKNILHLRKRFARVAPHILVNDSPDYQHGNNNRHHNQRHQRVGQKVPEDDGKESPVSNNNDTAVIRESAPKTTSTKLTGGTTRQNNIVWRSNVVVEPFEHIGGMGNKF